jgi:hypothetical protein
VEIRAEDQAEAGYLGGAIESPDAQEDPAGCRHTGKENPQSPSHPAPLPRPLPVWLSDLDHCTHTIVKRETQILARATDRILNGSEAAIVKTLTAAATQIAADLPSAAARGKRADAYVSTRSSMLWRAL